MKPGTALWTFLAVTYLWHVVDASWWVYFGLLILGTAVNGLFKCLSCRKPLDRFGPY